MKFNITINNKQVQAEINEEEIRAALEGEKGVKKGYCYWHANSQHQIEMEKWTDDDIDKACLKTYNAFKTEAEAYAEKMRRESIQSRLEFIPDINQEIWFWSFANKAATLEHFNNIYLLDWNMGCVKRTKEECEAWGAKYADVFRLP